MSWTSERADESLILNVSSLDRNNGKVKVIPEEEDKRRTLFWELLCLDTRLVSCVISMWTVP